MTCRHAIQCRGTAGKSTRWGVPWLILAASPALAAESLGAAPGTPLWTAVGLAGLAAALLTLYFRHLRLVREKTAELRRELLERQLAEKELLASEQQLRRSLAEKEALLKEIHHRVKNNLQIVSSLLYLQEDQVQDEKGVEMLRESQNRVRSMALIHEQLYGTSDLDRIDFGRYIKGLTVNLVDAYGIDPNRVRLNVNADDTALGMDMAVPCGLIINELVSNSLKHAFTPGGSGTIDVAVSSLHDGRLEIVVADDGVGMAETQAGAEKKTLGLRLVDTLTAQLDGSLEIGVRKGTRFRILLKITAQHQRSDK